MRAKVFHRSTCRLCDGADVERVVDIAPIPLAEKYLTAEQIHEPPELYPVDLYQCRTCGHVQIMDVIDPATLWQDFTYRSGQTQGIVDHLEMVAQQVVERRKPPPGSLVVDIGSNDGTFLNAFRKRGFKVLGVDPAKEIAREASARGIETLAELVTPELAAKIRTERGPANVVTVFNTFAHADDMAGMAESIRCLLAPDGVFLFEVQYLLDIIDHVLLGTIIHEHLCHHSLKPLASFLLRHGIEVIDVERNTIQMGSLIGTAQLQGGPRPVSDTFEKLLDLEDRRRLHEPETIRGFARRLDSLKNQAQQLKAFWKREGLSVAGYGAARSGPTLLAQLRLADAIEFVVDDHPQKVNRYTPGDYLPVLPTEMLEERRPDYTIILAWIHAKKIIAKHRAYLEAGGRFVICCPEVSIVAADGIVPLSELIPEAVS